MRATWKGVIQIREVQVPVRAYAVGRKTDEIHLRQVHAGCGQPIGYVKRCPQHGDLVADDVASAVEVNPGRLLELTGDEVESLAPDADGGLVGVEYFVDLDDVLPRLHYLEGKHYYLVPDGPLHQTPFTLLRHGLQTRGVAAIAVAVLFGREQLCLVRALGRFLVLDTLAFVAELQAADGLDGEVLDVELGRDERKLMDRLLELHTRGWDLGGYADGRPARLQELVAAKLADRPPPPKKTPAPAPALSLTEALTASLPPKPKRGRPKKDTTRVA